MTWRLKRTKQCAKCPWRKHVDPHDIPNGYCEEKHRALSSTIARPGIAALMESITAPAMRIMACHETHDAHCIGWLANQLGPGNNIALRMQIATCENAQRIRLIGEQHERFEDTLPR
jgi:hypothetical protein